MGHEAVRIRPARPADLARVTSLLGSLAALHARLQPGFFRAPKARPRSGAAGAAPGGLPSEGAILLVAEETESGEIVGAAALRLYDTPDAPEMRARRRVNVETLVVDDGSRRRAIGRRLMEAAEAWAKARGAEQMVLTVWAGNRRAAAFYRALGYGPAATVLCRELP